MFDELTDFLWKYHAHSITITVHRDKGAMIEVRRLDPGDRMRYKSVLLTKEELNTYVQPSAMLRFVGEQWAGEVGT